MPDRDFADRLRRLKGDFEQKPPQKSYEARVIERMEAERLRGVQDSLAEERLRHQEQHRLVLDLEAKMGAKASVQALASQMGGSVSRSTRNEFLIDQGFIFYTIRFGYQTEGTVRYPILEGSRGPVQSGSGYHIVGERKKTKRIEDKAEIEISHGGYQVWSHIQFEKWQKTKNRQFGKDEFEPSPLHRKQSVIYAFGPTAVKPSSDTRAIVNATPQLIREDFESQLMQVYQWYLETRSS